MKKTISFILSIVMVLSVLSVCGGISAFAADEELYASTTKITTADNYTFCDESVGRDYEFSLSNPNLRSSKNYGYLIDLADGLMLSTVDFLTTSVDYQETSAGTVKIYQWDTDHVTTVLGTVLCSKDVIVMNEKGIVDADGNKVAVDVLDANLTGKLYVELTTEEVISVPYRKADNSNIASFVAGSLLKSGDVESAISVVDVGIKEANVSLGTDISFNVYTNGGAKVEFTMNGTPTTVDVVKGKATLTGITPQCMKDLIDVKLLDSEGKALDTREDVTIAQLLADTKNGSEDPQVDALVDALLNYGAAAQIYRNYKADGVTVDTDALEFPETTVKDNNGVEGLVAAGVRFDYNNKVYFVLNKEAEVTIAIGDADAVEVKGEAYNGGFIYYSEGINATQFDSTVTLTVGDNTATYSVNSFAYSMKNNASAGNLAKALYTYGLAAEAYATK